MPPIYIMAVITLTASALLWGGLLYALSGRDRRYLWLLLAGLPLSALVNLAVKRPLIVGVGQAAGVTPGLGTASPLWFIIFVSFVPPVTEEAIKAAPLLIPQVRRLAFGGGRAAALWAGLALGISFGLGEAAFLAYSVAQSPAYAGYPWYAFTGYLGERLMVCLAHGIMTAVLLAGVQAGGRRAAAGYLGAVALHALLNAGAVLAQLGLIPAEVAGLLLFVPLLFLVLIFEWLRRRAAREPGAERQAGEIVYIDHKENRGE